MKEFRTELIPLVSTSPMGLGENLFTIGSCFADEIGSHLIENKFKVWNSRFGAVYNPISIHNLLLFGLEDKLPTAESYLQTVGINLNYHFHSSFSSMNENELQSKIKAFIAEAGEFLKNTNRIIITYGTAFVYRLKSNNSIVANCHKMPSGNFTKSLLDQNEIVGSFQNLFSELKSINPYCRIILTVSPVRHLKDTLELNAVSKSILRLSCHAIVNQFPDVEYFPAYEILLDDLRDYRFYKTDQLHPSEEAVEYIWDKFVTAYFDEPAKKFLDEWRKIKKDLKHKPFHSKSENHQKFLKSTLNRLEDLNSIIDLSDEIQSLKSEIFNSQSQHLSGPSSRIQ